ncbi:HNH endonuclease [Jeotgalibacillus proteolyticus]|uniref:HNH endonuclease n=1 Tax=Jeotgalibacillus proteolyticus TaxID=2082395 RepID=UPI003CEBBAF1
MPLIESSVMGASALGAAEISETAIVAAETASLEGSIEAINESFVKPETMVAFEHLQIEAALEIPTNNSGLEGQYHPETGVFFERTIVILEDGTIAEGVFPVFEAAAEVQLPPDLQVASDARQFAYCNQELAEQIAADPELAKQFTPEQLEQIANGDTPDGYSWHHHQDTGRMQLVDQQVHAATGHTGGKAIWSGGAAQR